MCAIAVANFKRGHCNSGHSIIKSEHVCAQAVAIATAVMSKCCKPGKLSTAKLEAFSK